MDQSFSKICPMALWCLLLATALPMALSQPKPSPLMVSWARGKGRVPSCGEGDWFFRNYMKCDSSIHYCFEYRNGSCVGPIGPLGHKNWVCVHNLNRRAGEIDEKDDNDIKNAGFGNTRCCGGRYQSPINIQTSNALCMPHLPTPIYPYPEQVLIGTFENTGYYPKFYVPEGEYGLPLILRDVPFTCAVPGLSNDYVFSNVHVHSGIRTAHKSAHFVNGSDFNGGEMHLVHVRRDFFSGGKIDMRCASQTPLGIVVIGVFLSTDTGEENPELNRLLSPENLEAIIESHDECDYKKICKGDGDGDDDDDDEYCDDDGDDDDDEIDDGENETEDFKELFEVEGLLDRTRRQANDGRGDKKRNGRHGRRENGNGNGDRNDNGRDDRRDRNDNGNGDRRDRNGNGKDDRRDRNGRERNGNGNGDRNGRDNGNGNGDWNGKENGNENGDRNGRDNGDGNGDRNGRDNGNGNGDRNGKENGNGNGDGNGRENGDGNGDRNGRDNGNGNGDRNGKENGNGNGDGNGRENGNGNGNGERNGRDNGNGNGDRNGNGKEDRRDNNGKDDWRDRNGRDDSRDSSDSRDSRERDDSRSSDDDSSEEDNGRRRACRCRRRGLQEARMPLAKFGEQYKCRAKYRYSVPGLFFEKTETHVCNHHTNPSNPCSEGTIEDFHLRPGKLLPSKPDFWQYFGSLTTPPCSEVVNWIVMKEPLKISHEQLNALHKLESRVKGVPISKYGDVRPIQPLNGRTITTNVC